MFKERIQETLPNLKGIDRQQMSKGYRFPEENKNKYKN
jgi:hypothetical protein